MSKIIHKCDYCSNEFLVYKSRNQKFCSISCGLKSSRNSTSYKKLKYEKVSCKYCKKIFESLKCQHRKYCSRECKYKGLTPLFIKNIRSHWFKKGHIPHHKGKWGYTNKGSFKAGCKHPGWQGGEPFEQYPLGWTKVLREEIRERDNRRCQLCNCSEQENGQKLSVHHTDYNKENLEPTNLISLCASCHMKTSFNREYWTEYFKTRIKSRERTEKRQTA